MGPFQGANRPDWIGQGREARMNRISGVADRMGIDPGQFFQLFRGGESPERAAMIQQIAGNLPPELRARLGANGGNLGNLMSRLAMQRMQAGGPGSNATWTL